MRYPWSLLQTQWLDVPIEMDPGAAPQTWEAFSEIFDVCLSEVSSHVARYVDDRVRLGRVVTEVFVDNLDVLVSHLGDHDKLHRLLVAADRVLERRC